MSFQGINPAAAQGFGYPSSPTFASQPQASLTGIFGLTNSFQGYGRAFASATGIKMGPIIRNRPIFQQPQVPFGYPSNGNLGFPSAPSGYPAAFANASAFGNGFANASAAAFRSPYGTPPSYSSPYGIPGGGFYSPFAGASPSIAGYPAAANLGGLNGFPALNGFSNAQGGSTVPTQFALNPLTPFEQLPRGFAQSINNYTYRPDPTNPDGFSPIGTFFDYADNGADQVFYSADIQGVDPLSLNGSGFQASPAGIFYVTGINPVSYGEASQNGAFSYGGASAYVYGIKGTGVLHDYSGPGLYQNYNPALNFYANQSPGSIVG